MNVTVGADSLSEFFTGLSSPALTVNMRPEGNSCVVHATGELDLATRSQLFVATTTSNHSTMVIDLAGVTFMDCGGYGCLVACRLVIEGAGRQLRIRGQTGQPARLLDLIERQERTGSADE